ncbi:phage tail assembly chaperone [Polaribacter sp.]|nr:phage tail assembly chaperone [Polaribacter sp.]
MEYRIQSTGEVKTQGEVRRMHSNTSLPRVWDANVCTALGIDPVLAAPKPEVTGYTQAIRNGATQDANGNWVQAWSVVDMFADTTEDGVTTTKAEHEAAYQADLDAKAAESVRTQRDKLLADTDWHGLSDVTMSAEMTAYRQALRDITTHESFPNLEESDWPVAP